MSPTVLKALTVTGIVACLGLIVFAGLRFFAPQPGQMDQASISAHIAAKNAMQSASAH